VRSDSDRPAYVLFAVLIVVVVLSLVAYQYNDAMALEYQAAQRAADAAQAKAFAVSGVHYAVGVIADPNSATLDLTNDAGLFSNQTVGDAAGPRGGGRFTLFNVVSTSPGVYERRYGLTDEGAKVNINMLYERDPTGTVLYNALMALPNMTEEVADSIVDWVDSDASARPNGGEDDYYMGAAQPYHCKNGPLNSVEELLLVKGVTPPLLFGTDQNRNGVQDANETTGGEFSRGWADYLTVYGREVNVDSTGVQRINLNGTDAQTLSDQLTAAVGKDLSDYILYYRFAGNGEAAGTGLGANKVAVSVGDAALGDLVAQRISSGAQLARQLTSVITVFNTQVPLPAQQAQPGMPPPPARVVSCPINGTDALKSVLATLLDKCTVVADYEMYPRINVTLAPQEVLAALPGLTADEVAAIVAARESVSATDPTAAWLVTSANLDPTKFKTIERYVTGGKSNTYRVHSVGYFGKPGGAVGRVEAVVEMVLNKPRIVYFRDLTDLGRGFEDLPR
jgi:type II secretory pathway component PulK